MGGPVLRNYDKGNESKPYGPQRMQNAVPSIFSRMTGPKHRRKHPLHLSHACHARCRLAAGCGLADRT